jgi:dolichyl-phosphate beta-glucosyltransferase
MNEAPFLTVIVPSYNEEKNIRSVLSEVSGYLDKRGLAYEVIVVDDGSSDRTFEYASGSASLFKNFQVLRNESNKGKGYSVRRAMLQSKGEYALFMDADNSTSIYEFDKFLPCLKSGYDIVIASRRLKDSMVEESQPLLRAKMGQFYIFLSKTILKLGFSDFNCGFKAYNMGSARPLFESQKMDDWSFDVELLFLANKRGLKVKEVPVRWVHKSGSKVRPFADAVRSFISVIRIKEFDLKKLYDSSRLQI